MSKIEAIAKKNGLVKVHDKLIEELAELTSALLNNNHKNTIEEMADVLIMIRQYIILTESLDELNEQHKFKIKRTVERLKL